MASRAVLLGATLVVFLGVGGVAFATGVAPGIGLVDDSTETVDGRDEPLSPENASELVDMDGTDAAFQFGIDSVEECGISCRNATGTLTNDGTAPATNVTVETNVHADGELLWSGREDVGRLKPGETYTSTQRIELPLDKVQSVQANDGAVTIQTIVRFAEGTDVFTAERTVA